MDTGMDRLEEKFNLDLGIRLFVLIGYFIIVPYIFISEYYNESGSTWSKITLILGIFAIYYYYLPAFFTSLTINDSIIKISTLFSSREIKSTEIDKIELDLLRFGPPIARFEISLNRVDTIKFRFIVNHYYNTDGLFEKVNYYFGLPENTSRNKYLWDYQENEIDQYP